MRIQYTLVVEVSDEYFNTEGLSQVGIQTEKAIDGHADLSVVTLGPGTVVTNVGKRKRPKYTR